MRDRGLEPDFPPGARAEAAALDVPPTSTTESVRDLRSLLWCSIDNDDSRDLDQLSVAEELTGGSGREVKVLVAIADVDAVAPKDSPIDRHAALNTTSVYTPAVVFPMLPEKLSTDLTSLVQDEDRLSIVIELVVAEDGRLTRSDVYGAMVRNRSKLAYNSVDAWLTGRGPLPPAASAVAGMDRQLKVQDAVAQALSRVRHEHGALDFETIEARPQFDGDRLRALKADVPNRAKMLIENLMVAANSVVARFLDARGFPSMRRVVRDPERWERIMSVAASSGDSLPAAPDSKALADFLSRRRAAAPDTFADLSHTIIKLLGPGEYVVDPPGADPPGHFGLAVKDYTHSTAPNRRFPDLITQRLLKAALAAGGSPYSIPELGHLAEHCTRQEDAANKVERQMRKSAAAMLVSSRIGERFDAIVTGASQKGTFVRVLQPPIEGKLISAAPGIDVGDHLHVQLTHVDVDRGYIDFRTA